MEKPNNVEELLRLGFRRFPDWDFKDPYTEAYRLDKSNNTYRAHVTNCNGPVYANLGIVINQEKGTVDRWRDCVSNGSLERKILFNENRCSVSMNTKLNNPMENTLLTEIMVLREKNAELLQFIKDHYRYLNLDDQDKAETLIKSNIAE